MKRSTPLFLILLAACSGDIERFEWPFGGLATAEQNDAYAGRRGQVELIVKSNFETIIPEINAGGGPNLTQAFDAASIPMAERPARITQLQGDLGLYAANPGALVTAIMLYGG